MIKYTVCNVYTQATIDYNAEKTFFRRCVTSISDGTISYEASTDITPEQLATRLANYGGDGFVFTTYQSTSSYSPEAIDFKYRIILPYVQGALISVNPVSSPVYWRLESLDGEWVAITTSSNYVIGGTFRIYHNGVSVISSVTLNSPHTGSLSVNTPLPWSTYIRLYTGTFDANGNLINIGTSGQINLLNQTSPLTKITYRAGGSGISIGTTTGAILYQFLNALLQNRIPPEPPPGGSDPYEEIPESEPGGGDGDPDFTSSDVVDYPVTPTLSAVSTGFTSLWCPDEIQMGNLATYLWNSDPLTTSFWKKIFSNPLDSILGLNIVPLTLVKDGTDFVCLGGLNTWIRMDYLDSQFVEVDCGEIDLVETWGAYLDYDPYTRLEIYLPYCGTYPLKIDDFMPGKISVLYKADLITGACVAMIKSTKSDEHGDTLEAVMYQFTGNIATSIPVTATQFTNVVRSAISFVAGTGQRIASAYSSFSSGVATTALATPEDTSFITKNFKPPKNNTPSSTNPSEIMSGKPTVMRSGLIGSACGLLSIQTPYLILTRPRQARPKDQNIYTGYPSFITETLGDLSGYTEVESIHLEGIPCTAQELNEIDELLKGGVIF